MRSATKYISFIGLIIERGVQQVYLENYPIYLQNHVAGDWCRTLHKLVGSIYRIKLSIPNWVSKDL